MIREADAGFVTVPGDLAAFLAKTLALAADSPACARFARNARAFAENRFAIDRIADRFEAAVDSAFARSA